MVRVRVEVTVNIHLALVLRRFTLTSIANILLNLRPLILGLTPFGWLRSITLATIYSIISCGNIIFDLRLLNAHFLTNTTRA